MICTFILFVLLLADFSRSQGGQDEVEQWRGILIAGGNDETQVSLPYFQIVNPLTKTRKTITANYNIPQLFHMAAAAYDDGNSYKIYFTGGLTTELVAMKSVVLFIHSPTKDQVLKVANMTKARGVHVAVNISGVIYVCGGLSTDFEELASCEKYDCVNDLWTDIPPMKNKRWGHAGVAYNGKIYIFGGRSGFPGMTLLSSTEVFDPATNQWTYAQHMPTPKYGMRAVAVNDKIYVCGGTIDTENSLRDCDVFDPKTNIWSPTTSMVQPRYGHHMIPLGDKIYIIGGSTAFHVLSDEIEEYDYINGKSRIIDDLRIAGKRFYFSAAAVRY